MRILHTSSYVTMMAFIITIVHIQGTTSQKSNHMSNTLGGALFGVPHYTAQFSIFAKSNNELHKNSSAVVPHIKKRFVTVWEEMKDSLPGVVKSLRAGQLSKTHAAPVEATSNEQVGNFTQCYADLELVVQKAGAGEIWAAQTIDAWGGIGSGILRTLPDMAVSIFLGDFDECHKVTTGMDFDTEYCALTLAFERIGPVKFPTYIPFASGVCSPTTCTAEDLKNVINLVLATMPNISGGVYESTCRENSLPLTTKAKWVISICSIFAALMLAGTIYDIVVVRGLWRKLTQPSINSVWLGDSAAGDSVKFSSSHRSEYEPLLGQPNGVTGVQHEQRDRYTPNWGEKALLSFSVWTNGEKLLSSKTGAGTITCINGIRFISMTWVILGHTFVLGLQAMTNVQPYLREAYSRWTFQVVINALVAVDTFFALSGFLMAYLVLKELDQKPLRPGFFGKFYFHRYWRLTPPYMLVLMTYVPLFKYVADGPMWPQTGVDIDECEGTWWTNLLYINNFVKDDKMCMGWSWYLSNDMQFYVVSPLIFIPLFYFGLPALIVPLGLLVGNMITAGVISKENKLPPGIDILSQQGDYFSVYYIKPYTRIGAYLVGIITGYLLYRTKCKARLSGIQVALGWAVAAAMALAVMYGPYNHYNGDKMSTDVAALYNALHKIAWSASICWVIFACASGYGGFINTLLSWSAIVPLSRLTYCAYLVHPLIIYYYLFSQREIFYLNDSNIVYFFLSAFCLSYMAAFIASLAYEAPFLGLEKVLMAGVGSLMSKMKSARPKSSPPAYTSQSPPPDYDDDDTIPILHASAPKHD